MRAIIEAGGSQVPVETSARCKIPRVVAGIGESLNFDRVLFVADAGKQKVGKPYIEGASVKAEVIGHGRFHKVSVFKFKRRVKYRRKRGHRQDYTEVLIKEINA